MEAKPRVAVRAANTEDTDAVRRLCKELGYDQPAEEITRKIEFISRSESDVLLLAVLEGRVAGLINMSVVENIESPPFAELRGLVVGESFRNRRIGEVLVKAGENWAREKGLDRVRVRTKVERVNAHRFYERMGYMLVKQQKVFDRFLVDE